MPPTIESSIAKEHDHIIFIIVHLGNDFANLSQLTRFISELRYSEQEKRFTMFSFGVKHEPCMKTDENEFSILAEVFPDAALRRLPFRQLILSAWQDCYRNQHTKNIKMTRLASSLCTAANTQQITERTNQNLPEVCSPCRGRENVHKKVTISTGFPPDSSVEKSERLADFSLILKYVCFIAVLERQ